HLRRRRPRAHRRAGRPARPLGPVLPDHARPRRHRRHRARARRCPHRPGPTYAARRADPRPEVPRPDRRGPRAGARARRLPMTRPTLRSAQPTTYSRILGIGGVRGENVGPNDEIVGPIDSSDEWIQQRTGIIERRRATEEQTIAAMTEEAARKALAAAGIEGSQLGAVIVATVTHLEQTPALATIIADRIGATPAAAYDISAACAGYCYGIAQADALVRAGTAEYVLVVGAERMSDFIDPTDRTISCILGDGAGAADVGPSDTPGIGPTVWGSDGGQADAIYQTHSW